MFDRVVEARSAKGRGLRAALFGVSTALHGAGIVGLLVYSFWSIEKLAPKYVPVTFLATAQPPPPPPPPPAPPQPPRVVTRTPKVVREMVQPPAEPSPDPPHGDPLPTGVPSGPSDPTAPTGDPTGVPGGTGTTPCAGPDCKGPPIVDEPPKVVDLKTMEAQRISGTREIPLPLAANQELRARGQTSTSALVQLCLTAGGVPDRVLIKRSTGFPAADARIADEVRAWRYRPYSVNGRAVPICTAVLFQYRLE